MNTPKRNFSIPTGAYRFCALLASSLLLASGCVPPKNTGTMQQPGLVGQPRQTESYYAGYSKAFLPYKEKLATGKINEVRANFVEEDKKILEKSGKTEEELPEQLGLINIMERASLSLQSGDTAKALEYCKNGQEMIEGQETDSYAKEWFTKGTGTLTDILGFGKIAYYPPGYEKVMLFNFHSIAYLLEGDDRAFNMARFAIDWQDAQRDKFEKYLAEENKKATENANQEDAATKQKSDTSSSAVVKEFAKYDDIALKVPNAYVNPFADYVTGMVNEFKSVKIQSLVSNAHIAYKQALQLNPESKALAEAVAATEKGKQVERLIHIVALNGFAPEKKVLKVPLDQRFNAKLPTYEPVVDLVSSIKVTTSDGKLLTTLSPVADIEALALREQKDALPGMVATLVGQTVIPMVAYSVAEAFIPGSGDIIVDGLDNVQDPDTTAWMSMPKTIQAGRIVPPKKLTKIKITSYDSKGGKLAEQTVKLDDGDLHFVLVRTIDKNMYAYPSKKIWSSKS